MENINLSASIFIWNIRRQKRVFVLLMSLIVCFLGVVRMNEAKELMGLMQLLSAGGDIGMMVIGVMLFRLEKRLSRVELIQNLSIDVLKRELTK